MVWWRVRIEVVLLNNHWRMTPLVQIIDGSKGGLVRVNGRWKS